MPGSRGAASPRRVGAGTGWRSSVVLGVALLGLGACAEPDELEPTPPAEPGEIMVVPTEGARLCAGTERWVSQEVARVIEQTGLLPRFDLRVEVGRAAVDARCLDGREPEVVLGCAQGESGSTALYTTPQALAHELVHGLRRQQELRTISLFEEGFAEALAGSDAHPRWHELDPAGVPEPWQPEALAQVARLDRGETYLVAAHFAGSLRDEHGAEAVAAFMRGGIDDGGEAAGQRFETHFGRSLGEAAQAWRDAGARGFALGDPCSAGVEPAPAGEVVVQVDLDCDDPSTMGLLGAGESAWVRRCLELPAGRMVAQLDHGTVRLEAVPGSCAEGSSALDAAPKELEAGVSITLQLAACTWALTFSTTTETAETPLAPSLRLSPE